MKKLGVNVDHVATLRQARLGMEPDPVKAATICEKAGCDSIVVHLREDRRHIQDADVKLLRNALMTKLNLEMSTAPSIVDFACKVRPDQITLVPEKRRELTTEGGLDAVKEFKKLKRVMAALHERGITCSVFTDPVRKQIKACLEAGADAVELHTGEYANSSTEKNAMRHYRKLCSAAKYAASVGLAVHAGHGLNYFNVRLISQIPELEELNIGHSIISASLFVGIEEAVRRMISLIK